jgi:hypothetical protein
MKPFTTQELTDRIKSQAFNVRSSTSEEASPPTATDNKPVKKTGQQWRLWEDIDGCYIFPSNIDPDDLCFGRVKPLAKLADSPEVTPLIQYLAQLPAFRSRKRRKRIVKRDSKAMRLQREHIHQSNADAVRSGSYIEGVR